MKKIYILISKIDVAVLDSCLYTKISSMNISVLSIIPNLTKELRILLPHLNFQEIRHEYAVITLAGAFANGKYKDRYQTDDLKKSKIVIGDFNLLVPHIYNLPKTQWIQGTWAGVDVLLPHIHKPLPYLLTRYSGHRFGQIMTEYVIASIVNQERELYAVHQNQKMQNWNRAGRILNYRVISDLTIGILGIGSIGSRIGKCLNTLGAKILAYGRRPTLEPSQENTYIAEYFTKSSLPDLLKNSDYIVNVLPSTLETTGLLDGNVLQNCKEKKSVLINIGRGTLINEADLVNALKSEWISAAILDVFQKEPLPKDSPLWSMEQVKITPHVAAVSIAKHIAEQFKENYELFASNKPIPTTVNFDNLY